VAKVVPKAVPKAVVAKDNQGNVVRKADSAGASDGEDNEEGASAEAAGGKGKGKDGEESEAPADKSKRGEKKSRGQDSEDEVSESDEDEEDYKQGGYHRVRVGDKFKDGRYEVIGKLGWGHFSTVWLVWDSTENRHGALKVVKSANHYTEAALDEIKLCDRIATANPSLPGWQHCTFLYDNFFHRGPHGRRTSPFSSPPFFLHLFFLIHCVGFRCVHGL